MGWQVAVRTDGVHGAARILEIDDQEVRKRLEQGQVVVMAGFQGIGPDRRITTLGRGGSDTSAVALAAALDARCDIYSDVDGVYTTDPRIVEKARRVDRITEKRCCEMGLSRLQGAARPGRSSWQWCMVPTPGTLQFRPAGFTEPGTGRTAPDRAPSYATRTRSNSRLSAESPMPRTRPRCRSGRARSPGRVGGIFVRWPRPISAST